MNKIEKLQDNWNLWFHNKKDNWKIEGYSKLLKFEYLHEYLYFINNYHKLGGLNNNHYIIMKNNILPIWEDENNINGGCISIKVNIKEVEKIWNLLTMYILGNNITNYELINGISICVKNPNFSIIQIWLKKEMMIF